MKSVETKRVTVETDYANKYEGILREKLQELRETYEEENQKFRDDTEKLYRGKVRLLIIVFKMFCPRDSIELNYKSVLRYSL